MPLSEGIPISENRMDRTEPTPLSTEQLDQNDVNGCMIQWATSYLTISAQRTNARVTNLAHETHC